MASPALCASYAAGVVCCCRDGGAHLLTPDVRRGLFTTARRRRRRHRGRHLPATRAAAHPDVGRRCRCCPWPCSASLADTELAVAAAAARAGSTADDLLVVDGPLPRAPAPAAARSASSRRHRSDYLPPRARRGGRRAAAPGSAPRCSGSAARGSGITWYLRLPCRAGRAVGRGGAGGVRRGPARRRGGVALAASSQVTLPRYASTEYKDSRAPQNLYPIAGLERALRRRLGEPARALPGAAPRRGGLSGYRMTERSRTPPVAGTSALAGRPPPSAAARRPGARWPAARPARPARVVRRGRCGAAGAARRRPRGLASGAPAPGPRAELVERPAGTPAKPTMRIPCGSEVRP